MGMKNNMLRKISDILKIAGIYTAVILGAGFASGQEILTFFINYGPFGFLGLCLSGIIFSFIGYATLKIAHIKKIDSASDFLNLLLGKFSYIAEIIIGAFLFILYVTMLSATGATLKQQFNLPYILGIILMATACFFSYSLGTNFIARINFIIAPILFFGSIFIGLYAILNRHSAPAFIPNKNWIKSAVLYSSYNIITGICVIIPMIKTVVNKKQAALGGILGGIFMTTLGIIIGLSIFFHYDTAVKNEIPMLAITNNFSLSLNLIYLIIFMLAVFTTAIGNFYSLCEIFAQKNFPLPKLFITATGIIFANIEFSRLVSKIYPIFGYIGMFEIILIAVFYFSIPK